jgi:flagellar biosynthetic protein FlhB
MAEDSEDKTEAPSGRKLDEARDRGQLGRSMDLNSSVILFVGIVGIAKFGGQFSQSSMDLMREFFGTLAFVPEPTDQWFNFLIVHVLKLMMEMMWPILVLLLVAGLVVNLLQVGLNFTTKPLEFDLKKLFNLQAVTGIFGKEAWIELLKGLAKMAAIGYVSYDAIRNRLDDILTSVDLDLAGIVGLIVDLAFEILWKVAILLLILGIIDWIYQKRKTTNDLKMTKEEVKEENKNSMGDPKTILARKRAMYKMHQQFMVHEVPKATVVITNPTFIAIAIRYNRGEDQVPVVVAKGKRLIAEHIRNLAKENGVPIVENKPLARAMYDQVQVGDGVPQELYNGVAEVLAYVFSMDKQKAAFV